MTSQPSHQTQSAELGRRAFLQTSVTTSAVVTGALISGAAPVTASEDLAPNQGVVTVRLKKEST